MSEEQSNFKVTDRRLFNADGSPREVPVDERPQEPPPPSASVADAEQPSSNEIIDATYGEPPPPAVASNAVTDAEAPGHQEIPGVDDPASFTNFTMSIASNAASSL